MKSLIFSKRSINRMLNAVSLGLGDERVKDLKGKLATFNEQTRPAEWEIVIAFALSQAGKITDFGNSKKGNPDFFWDVQDHKLLVEVTAVSDSFLHETNPVDYFQTELRRVFNKKGILKNGRYTYDFGDSIKHNKIVLGIPEKKDVPSFFSSVEFIKFLDDIRKLPDEDHNFNFNIRGANSNITYHAGQGYVSGGHRVYTSPRHIRHSPIFNSLVAKEDQIKKSGSELPAILVICDNGCDTLRSSAIGNNGQIKMADIVKVFLNGQNGLKFGDLVIEKKIPAQGRRIHAVIWISVYEQFNILAVPRKEVKLDIGIQIAEYASPFVKSSAFLNDLNRAFGALPNPIRTAKNANSAVNKYPSFFGAFTVSNKKVKFSALTLQKILTGEITFAEFEKHHKELVNQLRYSSMQGLSFSNVQIELSQNEDDDMVEFELGDVNLNNVNQE